MNNLNEFGPCWAIKNCDICAAACGSTTSTYVNRILYTYLSYELIVKAVEVIIDIICTAYKSIKS